MTSAQPNRTGSSLLGAAGTLLAATTAAAVAFVITEDPAETLVVGLGALGAVSAFVQMATSARESRSSR